MKNKELSNFYKTFAQPANIRTLVRDSICTKLKISKATFYNYISGVTSVPEEFKQTIADCFQENINILFPKSKY